MDHTIARFHERAERFSGALAGVAGRWDAATPCAGWTIADVVDHVIDTERDFLARQGLELGPAPDRSDPALAWRAHLDAVATVLADGQVAGRPYDSYFGPTTIGDTMDDFYGWDLVIHSWDVAVSTNQPWQLDPAEAAAMERTADGWGDALRMPGVCAAAVAAPADASPGDRLLARLGRDPRWSPANAG